MPRPSQQPRSGTPGPHFTTADMIANVWRCAFRLRLCRILHFRRNNCFSSAYWRPAQLLLPQGTDAGTGLSRFRTLTGQLPPATQRRNSRCFSKVVDNVDITILSTPNSNALKFIPGCDVTKNMSTTFTVKKRYSSGTELDNPLCEILLALDGVSSVMFCHPMHSTSNRSIHCDSHKRRRFSSTV